MTLQVKAEILLNNANWEKNLRKTSKQMEGFGKSMKTVANGIKMAWAGVALLAFGAVGDAIVDVTKKAAEERKSVALLNKTLEKNWHATDKTKESVADFITKQQNLTGILDDKLRPAFAKIATVVRKPEKAMKGFQLAMDVSAGTGKDLNVVSVAMAKFFGGNSKALDKLIPGLKNAADKIGFLQSKYRGMAAVAGSNDPFARINAVVEDFKEKIGKAFLPVVDNVADWLASPQAQAAIDEIATRVQDAFAFLTSPEGKKQMQEWMDKFLTLIEGALKLADTIAAILNSQDKANKNQVSDTRGGRGGTFESWSNIDKRHNMYKSGAQSATNLGSTSSVVQHITINGAVSGNDVVSALKQVASRKGVTLAKLLK